MTTVELGYTLACEKDYSNGRKPPETCFLGNDDGPMGSGYPVMVSNAPRQMFDTQAAAENFLLGNGQMLGGENLRVVRLLAETVVTASEIDPQEVLKRSALEKLSDEERAALGV